MTRMRRMSPMSPMTPMTSGHDATRPGGAGALAVLAISLVLVAAGCGGRGFAEVTGTVTMDGRPLAGAFVSFTPAEPGGVRGVGATNATGRYRVLRPGSKVGAQIGRNRVSVAGGDGGRSIPDEYGAKSTLTYEVTRGANVFDIDIGTK